MLGHTAGFSKLGVSWKCRHVFGDTLTALRNADINLFNMEFVTTDRVGDPTTCCKFRAPVNLSAAALRAANLNVALLANNHQKDDALAESIQGLAANGIASVGASMEREMRWRPRIFDVPGKPLRIAVLAFLRSESTGEPSSARLGFYERHGPPWVNFVKEACLVDPASACGREFRSQLRGARREIAEAGGANLTILSIARAQTIAPACCVKTAVRAADQLRYLHILTSLNHSLPYPLYTYCRRAVYASPPALRGLFARGSGRFRACDRHVCREPSAPFSGISDDCRQARCQLARPVPG